MSLTLFFLAVGYANNLIYIFVFFLISVAMTGMIVTNRNVAGIQVEGVRAGRLFCKEEGQLEVDVHNRSSMESWDIQARIEKSKNAISDRTHVGRGGHVSLKVPFRPEHRGLLHPPRIALQSTFPFGLLRAWKYALAQQPVVVFPERRGTTVFPAEAAGGERLQHSGLFRDHRLYQSADPLSRIDWRASARRDELLVKNYEEPEKPKLAFTWESTESLVETETRLSQLSLWIDEAERLGHQYSLKVPGVEIEFSSGGAHRDRCLTALALYQEGLT